VLGVIDPLDDDIPALRRTLERELLVSGDRRAKGLNGSEEGENVALPLAWRLGDVLYVGSM
jgi:hypothetical protein